MGRNKKNRNLPNPQSNTAAATHQQGKQQVVSQSQFYSGPIPHPALLKQYDDIVYGAAQRILSMAEENQRHRIDLEQKITSSQLSTMKTGQWMAFCLSLLAFGSSAFLAMNGQSAVAGIFISVTLVSLVAAFIQGRKPPK